MSFDEFFSLTDELDCSTEPWKWGHSESYKLADGRTVTGFFHCQEGIQEVIVDTP